VNELSEAFRLHVIAALGAAPEYIEPGKRHRFATNGKRSDLAGWCQQFEDCRAGVFGCWRQGISEVWTATSREQMTPSERAALRHQIAEAKQKREAEQRAAWQRNKDRTHAMGRQLVAVKAGDPVYRYLARRLRVASLDVPDCLRLHPAAAYVSDGQTVGTWPAMFAPITSTAGEVLAWHRTYLTDDGRKADVPGPVRKLTPACGLLSGAAIRLAEPSRGALGVAEGIETALGASLASGLPVMAAYSAGNLRAFAWPLGLSRLVIFADADNAGTDGAEGLRLRAVASGLACEVLTPTTPGLDWLDVFANRPEQQEQEASA